MLGRRSSLHRIACVALATFLLPGLAPGAHGARGHSDAAGPDMRLDFCAYFDPAQAPSTALPAGGDRDSKVSAYCPDCLACAGGFTALPERLAPWLPVVLATIPAVGAVPPATTALDVAAAAPRGPPRLA
jgi:hypothetical protein